MKQPKLKSRCSAFFLFLLPATTAFSFGMDDQLEQVLYMNMETSALYLGALMEGRLTLTDAEAAQATEYLDSLNNLASEYLAKQGQEGDSECKAAVEEFTNDQLTTLRSHISDSNYVIDFMESGAMEDSSSFTEQLSSLAFESCNK